MLTSLVVPSFALISILLPLLAGTPLRAGNSRVYTPGEIENQPGYALLPASTLHKVSPETVPEFLKPPAPPDAGVRPQMEARFREIVPRFGMLPVISPEWGDPPFRLMSANGDGKALTMRFKPDGEVASIMFYQLSPPEDSVGMDSATRFAEYATACYVKAFGRPPLGTLETKKTDLSSSGPPVVDQIESATWQIAAGGFTTETCAKIWIVKQVSPPSRSWTLHCESGPSLAESAAFTDTLATHPPRVTEKQAMTIAWKTWRRTMALARRPLHISCKLQGFSPASPFLATVLPEGFDRCSYRAALGPWQVTPGPAIYQISIWDDSLSVQVLVDRGTGRPLMISERDGNR